MTIELDPNTTLFILNKKNRPRKAEIKNTSIPRRIIWPAKANKKQSKTKASVVKEAIALHKFC